MSQLQVRPVQRAHRGLGLGAHSIAILLAASVIFMTGLVGDRTQSRDDLHGLNAECALLDGFLGSPELLASFRGTPEELQRWVDTYDRDCR